MSCVCLPVLLGKNFNIGHYMQTIQPVSFSPCLFAQLTSAILYHFIDLDHAGGLQSQHKVKPLGFIFSHTFQMIRIKFDKVLKQFQLSILILHLSEI